MANFLALKTAIQNAIKQNGNEEITGDVLQQILLSVVNTMGEGAINTIEQNLSNETLARQNGDNTLQSNINAEALARGNADTQLQNAINAIKANIDNGYVYAGIATPSSTPVSGKVFYIATAAGTYTNFGGQVLTQGINILRFNGSAWSSQQLIGIDDVPTAGSTNLVESGGVQNELALGAVYDVSAKNPTAGPNNDGKWESLAALLSDANLNTLIPTTYRKGGMSIKFVQTSDNKYVRYNLLADSFTTDTTQWAIADEGVYVENPEFVRVVTDNEDRILYAVKADGGFYFGAGVPQQIIDYVIEHTDATKEELLTLIDTKIDKEVGKSLIDAEYASSQSTQDNPEFLEVTTDLEDKVLEGIQADGTKVVGGDLNVGGSASVDNDFRVLGNMEVSGVSYKVIENPEYLAAWVDVSDKVIFGFKTDGKTYVGDADFLDDIERIKVFLANFNDKNVDWDALTSITATENPEYIEAKTDSKGKILAGRTSDGTAFENVGFSTPKISIDGHTIKNIEDLEGRTEILTDAEGKILSYRDTDGIKHEEAGIETNHLGLSDEGLTDLEKDLKAHGFSSGQGDWSDSKELHIAEPYCARVNFTGIDNIPQSKGVNLHGYMQFWDMNGNYFKKEVIMNAQGNSTMGHPKKNIAIDICNNNGWDDDDTFKLQIGSWVYQDSFHLKAYYNDPFRGIGAVGYKLFDKIVKSKGELYDYVWKRALIDLSSITVTSNGASTTEDTKNQYNTGARCFPDGFPCIVYLNGDFYGIYSFQLKKHRDNYHMDKKEAKHIHIDGNINNNSIFSANGDASLINWDATTDLGIEIRNPKNLYLMDGTKYDADNNAGELIDETSEYYDGTNEDHKRCAKVKEYILNLSKVKGIIEDAKAIFDASEKTSSDISAFKEIFETYLDVDSIIEYTIFSDICNNYDGFSKNWQWITYDGVKWYIVPYDLDGIFGGFWELKDTIYPPLTNHIHKNTTWLFDSFYSLYTTDAENMYATLRKKDIISVDTIMNIVVNWLDRIGNKEMFDKEWEKWPDFIKNDSVHRMYKWVVKSIDNMDSLYNYN